MAGRTGGASGVATFCSCGLAYWATSVGEADDRWQAHRDEQTTAGPVEVTVVDVRPGDTLVLRCDRLLSDDEYDDLQARFRAQYGPDVKIVVLEGGMRLEGIVGGLFADHVSPTPAGEDPT
jgi:hypothetical protein